MTSGQDDIVDSFLRIWVRRIVEGCQGCRRNRGRFQPCGKDTINRLRCQGAGAAGNLTAAPSFFGRLSNAALAQLLNSAHSLSARDCLVARRTSHCSIAAGVFARKNSSAKASSSFKDCSGLMRGTRYSPQAPSMMAHSCRFFSASAAAAFFSCADWALDQRIVPKGRTTQTNRTENLIVHASRLAIAAPYFFDCDCIDRS